MDALLWPLMVAVAWIMVQFHSLLSALGLDENSGLTWALSIVGLVVVIRLLLVPLFVRQIKAARGMQMMSPELQALQKRYKGRQDPASREAMTREMMELYRKHGTNPFASCLPILAQSPVFIALFTVLNRLPQLARGEYSRGDSIGPLTQLLAQKASSATIFDAPISSYFLQASATTHTKIVTIALIVMMSGTTFFTQKQLTQKNMPATALQGPMAQQQKMLLYMLPLVFAISGVNFPIGVLIYWSTTNLWSMGQQFYVIRRNPTPGSEAERRLLERRARKGGAGGTVVEEAAPPEDKGGGGQRQQPVRKDRAKGRPGPAAGGRPAGPAPASGPRTAGTSGSGPAAAGPKAGSGSPPRSARPPGRKGTGATGPDDTSADGEPDGLDGPTGRKPRTPRK